MTIDAYCGRQITIPQHCISIKTYVVTPHLNHLMETILMWCHNVCFFQEIRKIIFELSSIPLLSDALLSSKFTLLVALVHDFGFVLFVLF